MQKKTIHIFVAINLQACLPGLSAKPYLTNEALGGKGQVRLKMSQSKHCECKKYNPRAKYHQWKEIFLVVQMLYLEGKEVKKEKHEGREKAAHWSAGKFLWRKAVMVAF